MAMWDRASDWEDRFDRVLTVVQWTALGLGVLVSVIQMGTGPAIVAAGLIAAGFIVTYQSIRPSVRRSRWAREVLAVGGTVASMMAVLLTGRTESPYLLLTITPVFFASAVAGWRLGLETAVLSIAALVLIGGLDQALAPQVLGWTGLYLLIAVLLSYARYLLVEANMTAEALLEASDESQSHIERLQSANQLLRRLNAMAEGAELNPVSVGETALEHLSSLVEYQIGQVAISGKDGPVVVARSGHGEPTHDLRIPLSVGNREVGIVILGRGHEFEYHERSVVENGVRPMALAFSNILILQEIAWRAVQEERVRLARDLHDEIGPSLASLGLGLDVAMLQADPAQSGELEALRSNVAGLVEEVRATVADLRQSERISLLRHARGLATDYPDSKIVVDLQERRGPRAILGNEAVSLMSEAVRNAVRHSGADEIRISGLVDRDIGSIRISDDGVGFDPGIPVDKHYGVVGMRERARKMDAQLVIESAPGMGTSIMVEWDHR